MKTAGLLEHIRDVLNSDAQLASWCETIFGKKPIIYLGGEDEPDIIFPQSEYPVIVISSVREFKTDNFSGVEHHVPVEAHVFETGFDAETYTGLLHTANLLEQVADAVIRARFSKITTEKQVNGADRYPFFSGSVTLVLERIKLKRSE